MGRYLVIDETVLKILNNGFLAGTMMDRKYFRLGIAVLSVITSWPVFLSRPGIGADLFHKCQQCGKACQQHVLVEKTVMVPTLVTEMRVKSCVVESCEERQETYTCFVVKPVTKPITKECCYLADEIKTKKVTTTVGKVVQNPLTRLKKIQVPQVELIEKTIMEQICTECGPACTEKTCVCEKTRLVDDFITEQDCEPQLIFEKTTKDIFYCVKTPKKYKIDCGEEVVMKLEPVEKTRTVMVMVPRIEKQAYEVEVTRMLPKKIQCCVECSRRGH
jgi:hypothetical protein